MQKFTIVSKRVFLYCLMLVLCGCLFGCGEEENQPTETVDPYNYVDPTEEEKWELGGYYTVGSGSYGFTFELITEGDVHTLFDCASTKPLLGPALQEIGLIEGEEGPYGLYVKSVMGIYHDYAADGKYWALYIDGIYSTVGADQITIDSSSIYSFRVE